MVGTSPPQPFEWPVPAHWRRIDLLSDVHLQADMPRTFEAWRQHLLDTPADAVLILGDLFEVWIGDDARATGFESQCAGVLAEAARRCCIAFLPGNRDFLVGDALAAATGLKRLPDPTLLQAFGRRWLLSHGDALCLDDRDYMAFRAEVRSVDWARGFLSRPLEQRRALARAMRDASSRRQAALPEGGQADVDAAEALRWLKAADAPVLVHGHTHRPGRHVLGDGRVREVLGDWDLDGDAPRARMLVLDAQGLKPLDLASARA